LATDLDRLSDALTERYRFERELGRGGMATVYLAADLKHQRSVAIKVLRPELTPVAGTERFLREIAITARLAHRRLFSGIEGSLSLGQIHPHRSQP